MSVDFAKLADQARALRMAIEERDEILTWMENAKKRELELRKFIAHQLFPKPTEGVNRVERAGLEAKLDHKVNRKVLLPELDSLRPDLLKRGVPVTRLVEMEPKLVLGEYRQLSAHHRNLFDQVLLITESETPQLKINGK